MKRMYASDLGVGDTIVIPPSLVMSKAKIKAIREIPTKQGDMIIVKVESNGKLWSPSTAEFAFHSGEKVECRPFKVPLRERIWARVFKFFLFFDFTR